MCSHKMGESLDDDDVLFRTEEVEDMLTGTMSLLSDNDERSSDTFAGSDYLRSTTSSAQDLMMMLDEGGTNSAPSEGAENERSSDGSAGDCNQELIMIESGPNSEGVGSETNGVHHRSRGTPAFRMQHVDEQEESVPPQIDPEEAYDPKRDVLLIRGKALDPEPLIHQRFLKAIKNYQAAYETRGGHKKRSKKGSQFKQQLIDDVLLETGGKGVRFFIQRGGNNGSLKEEMDQREIESSVDSRLRAAKSPRRKTNKQNLTAVAVSQEEAVVGSIVGSPRWAYRFLHSPEELIEFDCEETNQRIETAYQNHHHHANNSTMLQERPPATIGVVIHQDNYEIKIENGTVWKLFPSGGTSSSTTTQQCVGTIYPSSASARRISSQAWSASSSIPTTSNEKNTSRKRKSTQDLGDAFPQDSDVVTSPSHRIATRQECFAFIEKLFEANNGVNNTFQMFTKAVTSLLWKLNPRGMVAIFQQKRRLEAEHRLKAELERFQNSVVGAVAAKTLYVPAAGDAFTEQSVQKQEKNLQWCWRETPQRLHYHDSATILGDPAHCWIKYDNQTNIALEAAFQAQGATGSCSLVQYHVSFDDMVQTNVMTGFKRDVQRMVGMTDVSFDGDLSKARVATPLPVDLRGERILVMMKGDIVQISKKRNDGYAFGSKLHHTNEPRMRQMMATFAGKEDTSISADCGWFELDATEPPSSDVLQKSLGNLALERPRGWDEVDSRTIATRPSVQPQSEEYRKVWAAFHLSNGSKNIQIVEIQRVQNLAMWQSYVVKRQTICHRDTTMNSKDGMMSNSHSELQKRFERRWLWHGSDCQTVDKILQQGFNRSFCGKNASMYGKGVYFARDASYAASRQYAAPDDGNCQYVLACRVVVGEFCKGAKDARTPDVRDPNSHQLYDSTVNDLQNPSIFVTYHDAQAYPEYLIKFKQS